VAERPTFGRKVEWKNSDFSDKRISHGYLPLLSLRWENSLQCDTEIQHQIRLHVVMRLAATNIAYRRRVHRARVNRIVLVRSAVGDFTVVSPVCPSRRCNAGIWVRTSNTAIDGEGMRVLRHLAHRHRMGKLPACLTQRETVALMKLRLALQIR